MFNNYYDVRNWLEFFIPLVWGKEELGLVRIENLLGKLGNPQRKFKSIHVAGTSGKGSTCWYIAKLLEVSNGLKIGLHISPHLVDIRERMQILESQKSKFKIQNYGSLMSMERFVKLFSEIAPVVEKIKKENPDLTPSYFEILVAASFKYFAEEKVDWAVVEVGLGGRLDATNVLVPEVSVITNIGLDHTEILGKTIEKISREKAGIIKSKVSQVSKVPERIGIPVVTGVSGRALSVIADVAKKQQAPLITIDTQDALLSNKLLAIETVNLALGISHLSFPLASRSERKRESRDWILDQVENDKKGLPGRFEEIEPGHTSSGRAGLREASVILDGAHNPDKIKYLINILRAKREVSLKIINSRGKFSLPVGGSNNNVILVVAFKKGKDWRRMVDLLVSDLPIKKIIATKFHAVTDTGRFAAVEPEEIADYIKSKWTRFASEARREVKVESFENSQEAVFEAISNYSSSGASSNNNLVLVTGSLYLVGEVRTMWKPPEF